MEYSKRGILLKIVFFVRGGIFFIRAPYKVWKKAYRGAHFDYDYSVYSGCILYHFYDGNIE